MIFNGSNLKKLNRKKAESRGVGFAGSLDEMSS